MRTNAALTLLVTSALTSAAGAVEAPQARAAWAGRQYKAHRELDDLGARIDLLERRARTEGETWRRIIENDVAVLRREQAEAGRALSALEAQGERAGRDLDARFNAALRDLRDDYRRASRRVARKH